MVDICENTFAFDGMLLVGAVIEFLDTVEGFDGYTKEKFQLFQKRLRYGLPTISAISIYELGFADRVIAQKVAKLFDSKDYNKDSVLSQLQNQNMAKQIQSFHFPSYYNTLLSQITQVTE